MTWTRREFVGFAGLLGLTSCARLEQSRLGKLTPNFNLGQDGPLRFAVLTDLHLLDSRSVGIVGRAVNAINNDHSIDFVAVLGDLSSHGTLPEMNLARHALERLRAPYFCVPGPHDISAGTEYGYEFYRRAFKKPQWKENRGGWTFIGLDTTGGKRLSAVMSDDSLAWLDDQLAHLDKDRPVVLFCHHPLGPNAREARLENAAEVLTRFQHHNLRLVASGHVHENQEEEHGGILFVTTACCSTTQKNTDEKGFRVFTLNNEQIQHEFIEVPA
ncbi:MAG: metallophosphoesterase [Candidatus Hydrogenedentes bacterium]|nr:metallophosphoesterase [Candidatus Hydrogenedentota bacterium]